MAASNESMKLKIDEWLENIKGKDLMQTFDEASISDESMIIFSPYHFSHRENNKIYLNCQNKIIYRLIYSNAMYNASLLKQIETVETVEMFLHQLAKKNTFKILGSSSQQAKNYKKALAPNSLDLGLENEVFIAKTKKLDSSAYINDVWSVSNDMDLPSINLDEYQQDALQMALANEFSVISGYAGTGKSATIIELSKYLKKAHWRISRIAPTGRAAQIINGRTIHSWLKPIIIEKPGGKIEIIGFNKEKLAPKTCVIIDEASMIDDEIWSEIMRVWKNSHDIIDKKMIVVGDPGQLEPVGEGKPFIELINHPDCPKTILKRIHRSKAGNGIIAMAHFVRRKAYLDTWREYPNITFVSRDEALEIVSKNKDIQMITPRRKGAEGSLALNNDIKALMTIHGKPEFYTLIWNDTKNRYENHAQIHLNDKIIIVKNMWEWNITNGTTGHFLGEERRRIYNHVTQKNSQMRKCYKFRNPETAKIFYLPANIKTRARLELAYAITIHKAQGSEYKTPILYLSQRWVDSKMLYTAITRAKENLYIYYPEKKNHIPPKNEWQ